MVNPYPKVPNPWIMNRKTGRLQAEIPRVRTIYQWYVHLKTKPKLVPKGLLKWSPNGKELSASFRPTLRVMDQVRTIPVLRDQGFPSKNQDGPWNKAITNHEAVIWASTWTKIHTVTTCLNRVPNPYLNPDLLTIKDQNTSLRPYRLTRVTCPWVRQNLNHHVLPKAIRSLVHLLVQVPTDLRNVQRKMRSL